MIGNGKSRLGETGFGGGKMNGKSIEDSKELKFDMKRKIKTKRQRGWKEDNQQQEKNMMALMEKEKKGERKRDQP